MSSIKKQTLPNLKNTGNHTIYEITFYFVVVLLNIFYMLHQVYKAGEDYFDEYFLDLYNDFNSGWSWIDRNKDVGDAEWILGLRVLQILFPFLCAHILISECLKKYDKPKLLQLWHIATGVAFILKYLGSYALLLYLIQPLVYYLIVQFSSRRLIWLTTVIFLIVQNYFVDLPQSELNPELDYKDKIDITIVSLAWTNLRCVNFFLDAIDDKKLQQFSIRNLVKLMSYVFYLPLLYHGPIILYSDFRSSRWFSRSTKQRPFSERVLTLFAQLIRYCFWWFTVEVILHYFYANSMLFHIELLKSINYHALYGVGYLMGQLFHLKYVVFYGISCSITSFELQCPVPPHPKCISRIHLYSDMWKNFDRGLYLFMVKYIYKPCAKEAGRLISSLICFTFVFIWHGLYPHVLIWSLLNYVGVSIESFGKEVASLEEFETRIDVQMYRRIKCILASPLLLMSAISFFFYHGGKEIGDVFVHRMLFDNLAVTFVTLLVLYCYCQVCTEIEHLEKGYLKLPILSNMSNSTTKTEKTKQNKTNSKAQKLEQPDLTDTQDNCVSKDHYPERLLKYRSTGQINISQSKKLNCDMLQQGKHRKRSPITDTTRKMLTWNQERPLCDITPLNFVEEYVQVKTVKPPIVPTKEEVPTNDIPNELAKSVDKHEAVDNTNMEGSTEGDTKEVKKKDILTRIDTLYKSKLSKEKKRKLWNLDRKCDK